MIDNRRRFLFSVAAGLFVPEWMLDPPKGRSMPPNNVTFTVSGLVASESFWINGRTYPRIYDENLR